MITTASQCLRLAATLGLFGLAACGMLPQGGYGPPPATPGSTPAAQPAGAESTPASESAAPAADDKALAAFSGTCLDLAKCYVRLAKDFCTGASECKFKMSIQGDAQDECKKALVKMPDVVKPLAMVKPGYAVPSECVAN